ncbi:Cdk2 interacts with cyclins A [Rasamsonia emersonii CBS 393.64]|uniref:cyclin-dependent kinase n=1 Tax=Rasamsonia emersonii (strain ATCC 16479 / CBS 393.64 / IMI 116815) TaxID=1408163 RepID=A0A0F4YL46_RASE3|nr:Cdk2 interacts with cyclins A [Rasamsonia emersonii CBS 393.64]KKA19017.1 Cdk2 interacts with cyclins A [Rasamsonia emersonii CBS 393.64]
MCQEAIDEADATESVAPVISSPNPPADEPEEEEESTEKGIKLGEYQRCLHHADGLVSTVYRSKKEDGTLVALKVTTPHLMNPPHDAKRERGLRTWRTLASHGRKGSREKEPANKKIIDVGTTCYRAPEILFGYKEYDTTVDLWAAGCVVAEAVLPNHRQLFDAGPAGTELALIQSIFTTLGTPTAETWPETSKLPDWGKVEFHEYPGKPWEEILKGAPSRGRDLTSQLIRFESKTRLSAAELYGSGSQAYSLVVYLDQGTTSVLGHLTVPWHYMQSMSSCSLRLPSNCSFPGRESA